MVILIFANGEPVSPSVVKQQLAEVDYIIAADGGTRHCRLLGITPDIVIGDLDSTDKELLGEFTRSGVTVDRHPVDKDATDLELALVHCLAKGATRVIVSSALGGRWDMSLANILLMANEKYRKMQISIVADCSTISILHPGDNRVCGRQGQRVSLLPLKNDVTGVRLTGFRYPLDDYDIQFGSTIGVSNLLVQPSGAIYHAEGILLCVTERTDDEDHDSSSPRKGFPTKIE
ncbi:thiamine diphosphokinase [Desulforhopalus singaporensis]|uniref:Thiamine diphosphokinase n=1 Tax=Desulforhopalus singaporensis TaxID=91360 RepID=A0A1H0J5Z6_9BACT|nr:thiamine diphosphokinase [Desulforhopalus singaporensis]SDO38889.1 thiamine pyrophosphokinase [Desulforhopalus singaporensis]